MGTKNDPGRFDCHTDAGPDEPIFTLRASDPEAPEAVRHWCKVRRWEIRQGRAPESDYAKVSEAMECARAMEAWYAANKGGR
mgnify:CR=1 FL=1